MKESNFESIMHKTSTELRLFTMWKNDGQNPRIKGENIKEIIGEGCFAALVPSFLNTLVSKAWQKEARDRRYFEREEIAKALLQKDPVRSRLCSRFLNFGQGRILMEKDVIGIVVETFNEDDLNLELSNGPDPVLFGIISYEILQRGVNDLCAFG